MPNFFTVMAPTNQVVFMFRGDTLVVGPDGLVYGTTAAVTSDSLGAGGSSVFVEGGLIATAGTAVWLHAPATAGLDVYHHVEIGEHGYVRGGINFAAVLVEGKGATVVNQGTLSGGSGLWIDRAPDAVVTNTGDILGGLYAGLHLDGLTVASIGNSGTIEGADGIEMASSTAEIVNTGRIVAHAPTGAAIDAGTAQAGFRVTNSGVILAPETAIIGSAFTDRVINTTGAITGDVLLGGGNDLYRARSGTVDGVVRGAEGRDTLTGGREDDTLDGGSGNDVLRGGKGDDVLTGSTGLDVFVLARRDGDDLVTDFANGSDKLDLSAIHFADFAAVNALSVNAPGGLLLDFASIEGGSIFLAGMTKAQFDAGDVVL